MSDMLFLKPQSTTWILAWDQVYNAYHSLRCEDPVTGETWQYMSSVMREDGRVEHQFRHRSLPATGKKEYFSAVTTNMPDDYIKRG